MTLFPPHVPHTASSPRPLLLISLAGALALSGCVTTGGNQPATARGAFGVPLEQVETSGTSYIQNEQRVVIGTFRIAFSQTVSASARSSSLFSTSSTSASMSGKLIGLDTPDYQAITDAAHADFVAKLRATGLEVITADTLQPSSAYAKLTTSPSPLALDSSTTGNVLMLAANGTKLALFPGEAGVGSAFSGFDGGSPLRVFPNLIKEQQAGVLNVTYYIDFLNASTSGNTQVMGGDAEVTMGQGLSVRPGSGIAYTTLKGSQCVGYCPNANSSIKLGQAIFSAEAYGSTRDVTAGGVNAIGVISGLLSGQSFSRKDLEIQADPARYRAISSKLLTDANTALVDAISQAR